jgi:hypothetical protein
VAQSRPGEGAAFKYIVIALLALIAGGGIMAWLNLRTREAVPDERPEAKPSPQASPAPTATATATPTPGPTPSSSLEIKATASSTRASESGITYEPGNVLDQSLATAWIEGASGPGINESIRFDFTREVKLNRIIITPGYFKTPELWKQNNRLAGVTFYFSDNSSQRFTFPDRMVEQRLEVGGIKTGFVRMTIDDYYPGAVDAEDTPISSVAFVWE